jgi:hypothetical protein
MAPLTDYCRKNLRLGIRGSEGSARADVTTDGFEVVVATATLGIADAVFIMASPAKY